ncbi:MAG: metal-dependent hydrolase [Halobacteriota archaeon]
MKPLREAASTMPDPITHLIVATSLLWLFWEKKYRNYVLLLSPLAVFPDLDHLVPPFHRLLLHNVFIFVPTISIALYARFREKNEVLFNVALIATFYLLSHLLLDLFTGAGVPLFYPLSATTFGFTYELIIAHSSLVLIPEHPALFMQSELLGIAVTSLALAVIIFVKNRLPFQKDVSHAAQT